MPRAMSQFRRELFVVLGISAALFGLSARQIRNEFLLSRHAQGIQATIVSKQSHAWVGYTYVVDGVTYAGNAPAPAPINRIDLGERFSILFDPTNPNVSGNAETHEVVLSTVLFLALATIVAVCIVFVRNAVRRRPVT
jgi:hypothetical protein